MSNTPRQRPASENGKGPQITSQHVDEQIYALTQMCGQAMGMVQGLSQSMAQYPRQPVMLCTPCVAHNKAWEAMNAAAVAQAVAIATAPPDPDGPPPMSVVQVLTEMGLEVPQPQAACTMATIEPFGTCLVCPGHCPADPRQVPPRPQLLIANANVPLGQLLGR